MKQHESVESTPAMQDEQPEVKVAFNPFALLSEAQVTALAGRFNKTWRTQNSTAITDITAMYGCSTSEASFAVFLMNDADGIITRNAIKNAAESIVNLLDEVLGKNGETALKAIDALYSSVDAVNRPDVGKLVRKQAAATYTLKIADLTIGKVCEYLKIKESEWK